MLWTSYETGKIRHGAGLSVASFYFCPAMVFTGLKNEDHLNATLHSKPFQRLTLLRSLINQFLIGSSVVQLCCSIVLITDDNGDIQHEGTNY